MCFCLLLQTGLPPPSPHLQPPRADKTSDPTKKKKKIVEEKDRKRLTRKADRERRHGVRRGMKKTSRIPTSAFSSSSPARSSSCADWCGSPRHPAKIRGPQAWCPAASRGSFLKRKSTRGRAASSSRNRARERERGRQVGR